MSQSLSKTLVETYFDVLKALLINYVHMQRDEVSFSELGFPHVGSVTGHAGTKNFFLVIMLSGDCPLKMSAA